MTIIALCFKWTSAIVILSTELPSINDKLIRKCSQCKYVNSFTLSDELSIIEGTPFLYLPKHATIVLGDVHLGHETIILGDEINQLSPPTKILRDQLLAAMERFEVNRVIFNGDIKHMSFGVTKQERVELSFLLEEMVSRAEVILVKGNHDRFLKFALKNRIRSSLSLVDNFDLGRILITHGDQDLNLPKNQNLIILSHEHPAFVFNGAVGERIKLPAFAKFEGFVDNAEREFVILPATSALAGGVPFPPKSSADFLSPLLKRVETPFELFLYPYDPSIGVLPVPPIIVG